MRDPKGRFLPGYSGNPGGRTPYQRSLTETIRAHLSRGMKQQLVEVLFAKASQGDLNAIRLILEYHDGKPLARHEITGDRSGSIILVKSESSVQVDLATEEEGGGA